MEKNVYKIPTMRNENYNEKVKVMEYSKNITKEKSKSETIFHTNFVLLSSLYGIVFLIAGMLTLNTVFSNLNYAREKYSLINHLSETKKEVSELDKILTLSLNLKEIEKKSNDLGFVYNNNVLYVKK